MEEDIYSAYSFLLDKTSRRVKQYAKTQFNELKFGITVDQWVVLKNLYPQEGINQSELAKLTFKGMPTLTNIIDLLIKKEMVYRQEDKIDRRKTCLSLTPKGKEKVETISPQISTIRQKAWEGLSKEDFDHFQKVLNTIYNNLED